MASLTRGDTYYVAGGNYAAVNFNTTEVSTSLITIKGATIGDHGGAIAGWNNSFSISKAEGGTQLTFSASSAPDGIVNFSSGYWVFDGNAGPAYPVVTHGNDSTYYGFNINLTSCASDFVLMDFNPVGATTRTTVTVKNLSFTIPCTSEAVSRTAIGIGCGTCNDTNILVSHIYGANLQGVVHGTNYHDSILEDIYIDGTWGDGTHHSDALEDNEFPGGSGLTPNNIVRYSVLKDCSAVGTGGLIALDGSGTYSLSFDTWLIYGNIFDNCSGGSGAITVGGNNAAIANTKVFNNTFANGSGHPFTQCENAAIGCAHASGNVAENNLVWASDGDPSLSTGGAMTVDHNTCASVLDACYTGQTNGQTYSDAAGTLTFVSPSTLNFNLLSASTSNCSLTTGSVCWGTDLSGTFPGLVDMAGNPYLVAGNWTRGALSILTPSAVPGSTLSPGVKLSGGVTLVQLTLPKIRPIRVRCKNAAGVLDQPFPLSFLPSTEISGSFTASNCQKF